MLFEVNLPALSPTMEEGKIVKWIKNEKDQILSGEVLFEVETDKATMEYESPEDGYVAKIMTLEGETANINQLVGIISDDLNFNEEDLENFIIEKDPSKNSQSENIIDQQMNIPLLKNCNNEEFNLFMEDCVLPALTRFAPEAIIIQGGADAVCDDPLSRLALSNYTLWSAVKRLKEICDKIILTGGGGYNPWTVARLWAGFWLVLNDHSPFIELPSGAQRGLESLSWQHKLRPSRVSVSYTHLTLPTTPYV